jgi:hypothetical protein
MTYVQDLHRCDDLGGTEALGVGWLDVEHEFPVGPVGRDSFVALVRHLSNAWQPFVSAGRHACPFCRFSGGPSRLTIAGHTTELGASLLLVPAPSALYVAPSLIAHYIDAHGYQPPVEFMSAVAALPEMRSMAYLRELRRFGVSRERT